MSLGATGSVYTVASDMDLVERLYEGALEHPPASQDRDNWFQFKPGQVSFALSLLSEAAEGARGSLIVLDAADLASIAARIERLGGRHQASRDIGAHGSVATFAGPEGNLFQLHVRPRPSA